MSLLLTRHVDEYGIDIRRRGSRVVGIHRLHSTLLEPLTNEIAVKTITLDDQHAPHGCTP